MTKALTAAVLLAILVAGIGCATKVGVIESGMSRDAVRNAFGEPAARVNELTGDDADFCLALSGKRPQLVERWTYIVSGVEETPQRMLNIYFDQRGKLFASMTAPALKPSKISATQPQQLEKLP